MSQVAAKRYSKALLLLAGEEGIADRVLDDLQAVAKLFRTSREFRTFAETSIMGSAEKRAAILDELFRDKLHPRTLRFLHFADHKGRLGLIADIAAAFERVVDEERGILPAVITSAVPLTDEQVAALETRLGERFGKSIASTRKLDPSLIGGFRVQIGDNLYDYSIDTQLRELNRELVEA